MKIKNEVFNVLKKAIFLEPSTVILQGELNRKLYIETNKILEGLGMKWDKKSKSHISAEDITEKWYNMIDTGEWIDVKKELQFFQTPKNIVNIMVNKIKWLEGMKVLEPSAGLGNIVFNLPDMKLEIDVIEINKEFADKLNMTYPQNSNFYNIMNVDFMEFGCDEKYDIIIANPPFTKLQDVKHFNKMISLLKEGGKIVCILSSGSYERDSSIKLRQEFKKFIDDNKFEVQYLDSGEFLESGTNVSTIMVSGIKR